jgi:hypothetical protein
MKDETFVMWGHERAQVDQGANMHSAMGHMHSYHHSHNVTSEPVS